MAGGNYQRTRANSVLAEDQPRRLPIDEVAKLAISIRLLNKARSAKCELGKLNYKMKPAFHSSNLELCKHDLGAASALTWYENAGTVPLPRRLEMKAASACRPRNRPVQCA
jgi:hypothetical protein